LCLDFSFERLQLFVLLPRICSDCQGSSLAAVLVLVGGLAAPGGITVN